MSVWLVLFSCVFIIFTTLSIGVSERTRRLALLRALGMSRMQIALLIVGEGLFLCIPACWAAWPPGSAWCTCWRKVPPRAFPDLDDGTGRGRVRRRRGFAGLRDSRLARFPPVSAGGGRSFRRIHGEGEPCSRVVRPSGPLRAWRSSPAALLLPGLEVETRKWMFVWLGYPGLVVGAPVSCPRFRPRDGMGRGVADGASSARAPMRSCGSSSAAISAVPWERRCPCPWGFPCLWPCRPGDIPCWFLFLRILPRPERWFPSCTRSSGRETYLS